jgi:hypothetical protein
VVLREIVLQVIRTPPELVVLMMVNPFAGLPFAANESKPLLPALTHEECGNRNDLNTIKPWPLVRTSRTNLARQTPVYDEVPRRFISIMVNEPFMGRAEPPWEAAGRTVYARFVQQPDILEP